MSKKKKKNKKRSKIAQAALRKASQHKPSHSPGAPVPQADLDGFYAIPSSFGHGLRKTSRWRCVSCQHQWYARPDSQARCIKCGSESIDQDVARYQCSSCGHEYWDFPGPSVCPSANCKQGRISGSANDSDSDGVYLKWLNYEELAESYLSR